MKCSLEKHMDTAIVTPVAGAVSAVAGLVRPYYNIEDVFFD
jgi:hypothetical protein